MESAALVTFADQAYIPDSDRCPSRLGVRNVDGRCIMGGEKMPAGLRGDKIPSLGYPSVGCSAYPVYMRPTVPYVANGVVTGSDLDRLNNVYYYTQLNEDVLFGAPPSS